FMDKVVNILKPFEEITRHFSGLNYPTINFIYLYICMLKNKYIPVVENDKSVEGWIELIYGLESSDDDTIKVEVKVANVASIRDVYKAKHTIELDDTNTIKYLPSANCISNEVGLKASMLDLRVLKLLPFTTNDKCKNTEIQLHAELLVLEAQSNQNNNNTEAVITAKEEE
ncbi:3820_t:CDS:2, partial [Scutellospora calospora]